MITDREMDRIADQVAGKVASAFISATMQAWVDATPGRHEATGFAKDRDEWTKLRAVALQRTRDRLDGLT